VVVAGVTRKVYSRLRNGDLRGIRVATRLGPFPLDTGLSEIHVPVPDSSVPTAAMIVDLACRSRPRFADRSGMSPGTPSGRVCESR
jgi:hypothetical protein